MSERYDRSACASELLLRDTIVQKMADGWGIAESFHLPSTVTGRVRIGKELPPTQVTELTQPHNETVRATELTQPHDETAREVTPADTGCDELGEIDRIFGEYDSDNEPQGSLPKQDELP